MPNQLVMVVDADQAISAQISATLQAAGYSALIRHSLEGANEAIMAQRPAAVLVNLVFSPHRHGVDLVTVLKLQPQTRAIPVVLYSSDGPRLAALTQRIRERAIPGCWTITWPFSQADIARLLRQLIR